MQSWVATPSVEFVAQERNIGRAKIPRLPRGRAKGGRSVGKAPLPERAVTSVLPAADPEAPPVFVDATGTRRRRLRLIAYGVGFLLVAVLVAVWLSQLGGGPAAPPARTPCPAASGAEGCAP